MDLPKTSVDRLVQAISPALGAELEQIFSEVRREMEAEFETKIQSAVEETKERAMEKAAYELQLAVDETRDAVRTQVTREQQQQFEEVRTALERRYTEAAAQFEAERTTWTAEGKRLQQQLEEWRSFAEAYRRLAEAASQAEILIRWLKIAEPFAESVAIYTAKADGLALWKSRGPAAFPEIVSRETIDPEFYFRSINVRERTVAAVCASHPTRSDALDFLVEVLEFAIELFGSRLRTSAARGVAETARLR